MIDEPFATGTTLFHQRDVRVKLIAAAAISLVLSLCSSFLVAGIGCIITGAMAIWSKPDPHMLLKRFLTINVFTLFLWFTLPLTYGGHDTLDVSVLHLSLDGIRLSALITLKTNGIFFCFLALLATSTTANLGNGLVQLGVSKKLIFILLFSYRQLFVIHQEYQRLQRAAKLRGFVPKNSLHTYRTYSYLFGMTLVKSWNRSERIHQAMLLRGFNGKLIPLHQAQPQKVDYIFLLILLLISLFLVALSFFQV